MLIIFKIFRKQYIGFLKKIYKNMFTSFVTPRFLSFDFEKNLEYNLILH